MRTEFYPLTVTEAEYNEGVDLDILDDHMSQMINIYHKKFFGQGIFYDIFSLDKNDKIFQDIASQVRTEYNEYVMRIMAVVVLEPWIDYLDAEEEYYDYNREKFVPYSKYCH